MAGIYISFRFKIGDDNKERQISVDFRNFIENKLKAKRDGSTSSRVIACKSDQLLRVVSIIKRFLDRRLKKLHIKDTVTIIFYDESIRLFQIERLHNKSWNAYSSIRALFGRLPQPASHQ